MITIARLFLVFMILATIVVFYVAGIGSFPDYDNYLKIADGAELFVSEHDYMFEWFSRYLLDLEGVSATQKVFVLAIVNQFVCVVFFAWVGLKRLPEQVYGALFLFCMFGFLFMTTTLRASAAYLCISAFFLRNARFDYLGIALLVISMAWHDSAAPVVVIIILSILLDKICFRYKIKERVLSRFFVFLILSSGALVLLAGLLRPLIPTLIGFDLGARTAYFEGDGGYSISKSLFIIFSIICSYCFIADLQQTRISIFFIALMVLVLALFNLLNGIVAVRFSFFIFAVMLPLRGVFISGVEKNLQFRISSIVISPIVMYLSVLYTFSNTL